jgi:precorrin-2 dehydrogenase / sirohydrochlorin ferrochelatase
MATDKGYPILLRLDGRCCVVVGGGKIATRKVTDLLAAGALVTVISPVLTEALTALAAEGRLQVYLTEYIPGALVELRPLLVFAATDSRAVNHRVVDEARALGALVDTVDHADTGDFSSMATIRREALTLAIATGGAAPALTVRLRQHLEALIGPEYGMLVRWMADLRPFVYKQIASEADRAAFWRTVVDSTVLDLLRTGDEKQARQVIDALLAEVTDDGSRS